MKLDRNTLYSILVAFLLFSVFLPQDAQAELTFSFKWGSSGDDNDEFQEPSGIVTDNGGSIIYVADKENNRIIAFDDDGDYDFDFGTFCNMASDQGCNDNAQGANVDGDGQFNEPTFVTVDAFGDIFVADSLNDRVQRFDDDGDFEIKFGSSDSGDPDYLGSPAGIAIQESTRNTYVSSEITDSILVFDQSGGFEFSFGSAGGDEGEFRNPSHMLIDNSEDFLYVADTDNDRIQIFELVDSNTCPAGTSEIVDGVCFVKEFGTGGNDEGEFNSPTGLAFDHANDLLYVADTKNDRIQIFELVDGTTCPQDTEEIVDGVCFVDESGSLGTGNGNFNSPTGLALDTSNDLLYVADADNDRIQVFDTSSSSQEKPGKPTQVNAAAASPTSIILTWNAPVLDEGVPAVTGYKIEFKEGSENFATLVSDTQNPNTSYLHEGLDTDETYTYRVYAINSVGESSVSSQSSAEPGITTVPAGLMATAISPNQIYLSWNPPSETFGQTITGYLIEREIIPGVYDTVAEPSGSTTSYTVSNLQTDKTYTFVVSARFQLGGGSDVSNLASATPKLDSKPLSQYDISTPPTGLTATAVSPIQIDLSWSYPSDDGGTSISGYRIDVKSGTGNYVILVGNTDSTVRTYSHLDRQTGTTYTYKVYALNAAGESTASNEASATPTSSSGQTVTKEKPGPPSSLSANNVSPNQINLSWNAPTN